MVWTDRSMSLTELLRRSVSESADLQILPNPGDGGPLNVPMKTSNCASDSDSMSFLTCSTLSHGKVASTSEKV